MSQTAKRAAAVVQTHLVRKARPRKRIDFQDVVEKLDQFVGSGTDLGDGSGLFYPRKVMTDMMDAAARRTDDVVEPVEVANEQRFGAARIRLETAVRPLLGPTG